MLTCRRRPSLRQVLALGLSLASWFGAAPALGVEDAQPKPGPQGDYLWIRTRQDENRVLRLQMAIREFAPKDAEASKPTVTLYGAVHIADRSFYKRLEQLLEANHDVILYEGVKPAGLSDAAIPEGEAGDAKRAEHTRERLRIAWSALERWRKSSPTARREMPPDLDTARQRMGDEGFAHERAMLAAARFDAWGRPFRYTRSPDGVTYELGTLGRDNQPGGEGPDRDLFTADLEPLKEAETSGAPGLQERLARTFGLSFQLNEMAHDGPKWVNSDMSIDEVERALGFVGDAGGSGDRRNMLFQLLDGSSLPAKVASAVLGLIESIPGMAPRLKVMMVELLANLDERALANAKIPGMEDASLIMKVIIEDRNQVVIDDLAAMIRDRPDVRSIGVIYGAGHLPDLARRLENQLGYTHRGGKWLTAITVDLHAEGISDEEIAMTRRVTAMQMKMLGEMGEKAGSPPKN